MSSLPRIGVGRRRRRSACSRGSGRRTRSTTSRATASASRRYYVVVTDYSLLTAPSHGAYRLSVFSSQPGRSAKGFGAITSGDRPGPSVGAFVFGGGSDDDLLTATGCSRAGLRVWASRPDGSFVGFIPGATVTQANALWTEAFPFGIPAATALVGQCLR